MTWLRNEIGTLPRFPTGQTLNVSDVAQFMGLKRPISIAALIDRLDKLPDAVPFTSTIVTGAALGGSVALTLTRAGGYVFAGSMRATGIPSFSFRVVAVVRSASGTVAVAAQHSGHVFGTDTPGPRDDDWSEVGNDATQMKVIRNLWPDVSAGSLAVSRSSDLAGVLGTAVDVIGDIAEFFVVADTLGADVAVCLVAGSELGKAGVSLPGLGGVVGLGVVGGVVYIFGPFAIVPALVAGVAAGEIVDSMVRLRPLQPAEVNLARRVFGDSLDYAAIRLTNLSGLGGRAFTTPTVSTTLVNIGNAIDTPPDQAVFPSYPAPGQILIHELTHAWQIQHASLQDGFVPGLMCQGVLNQTIVSRPYDYGPPGQPWSSFNMEAQGAIVDQWFGGNGNQSGSPMDKASPYFGYVANNILVGVP